MARIYVLSAGRRGDLGQLTDVAKATGLPCEVRHLQFRKAATWRLCLWPKHFLITAVPEVFTGIGPRDVVLCAEASVCALVAQQRRSGTDFIAVCIGRPRGYFDDFDLIITSPQYELPPGKNIVELTYPPHQLPDHIADDIRNKPKLATRCRHVCLIGGNSAPDLLDQAGANRIIDELQELTSKTGCEIDIMFSPRTTPAAQQQIATAAGAQGMRVHDYSGDNGKSYWSLLANADSISVTSDSVSMLVESMLTGRPVHIHQLTQVPRLHHRLTRWLHRKGFARSLFQRGILEPRPNRKALRDKLKREGFLAAPHEYSGGAMPTATTLQAAKTILSML